MRYGLRFYDSAGRLVSRMDMICKDDAAAIAIFDCIKREYDTELWQGTRLVARADADRASA